MLDKNKQRVAQALRDDPNRSVAAICTVLGISRTTFYRYTQSKKL